MSNEPIRILQVVHAMNQGGVENFLMNIYRKIDRSKIQFDFVVHVSSEGYFDSEIKALGGKIYHCFDYKIYNHLQYVSWWGSFFSAHGEYKIVHSHLDSCANIHLRVAKKHGLKTVAHAHNTAEGFGYRAAVKKLLKVGFNGCCEHKFACSRDAAQWLFGKQADKATIVNNAIDVEKFVYKADIASQVKQELGLSGDEFVVGHVGRFNTQKNHGFLIEIFAEVLKFEKNAVLLLIGEGDLEAEIRQKVKAQGIEKNVRFLGIRSDVNRVLQAMDVFLFPSLYEGLGIVIIEAQAAGLPCVISDTVPSEAVVTDLAEKISLESSVEIWAKAVVNNKNRERGNTEKEIRKAGYDIKATADIIMQFYLEQGE